MNIPIALRVGIRKPGKTVSTLPQVPKKTRIIGGIIIDALCCAVVFIITALTIYPFFMGEFTQNWGSIESAFLSDAKFVSGNYPNLGWYPYWYGGIPFHVSYPPLLPLLVAGIHIVLGWSIGHSYRILTGISYAAIPSALYVFAKSTSKSRVTALISSFAFSLVPTFFPNLIPSHIETLAVYGEGPHILALPFILLSITSLLHTMNRPSKAGYLITAFLVAIVALTNVIALFAFTLFALVALVAGISYGSSFQALRVFFIIVLISYGLVAFQYTFEFIQASATFSAGGGASFLGLFSGPWLPVIFITMTLVPGMLVILGTSLRGSGKTSAAFLSLVWFALFGVIVLGKQLLNVNLAPQPIRYGPELDLSVAFLLGIATTALVGWVSKLRPTKNFGRIVKVAFVVLILSILAFNSVTSLLPLSQSITAPSTTISGVPEYQIATWLSTHVTDERVYASGTPSFWLNVFSDVQQIRGGSEQGAKNPWWAAVGYEINTGTDPQLSVSWAKAWNVKYIVVTFPNATTTYHDFIYPNKFNATLPLRFYYEGYGIYEVPLSYPSLVECVSSQTATSLKPISGILDQQDLQGYLKLTDSPAGSHATYSILNPDQITISVTNASPDTAVLIKMSFDQRWQADINNQPVSISQIGPGFMIVYPATTGDYQINLHFGLSTSEMLGYFLTVATIIGVPAVAIVQSVKSRLQKHPAKARDTSRLVNR